MLRLSSLFLLCVLVVSAAGSPKIQIQAQGATFTTLDGGCPGRVCPISDSSVHTFVNSGSPHPDYPIGPISDFTNFIISFSIYPTGNELAHGIVSQYCCAHSVSPCFVGTVGGFLVDLLKLNSARDDYDASGDYYLAMWTNGLGNGGDIGPGLAWQPYSVPVPTSTWTSWKIVASPEQFQICRTDQSTCDCETFDWLANQQKPNTNFNLFRLGIQGDCNHFEGEISDFAVCQGDDCNPNCAYDGSTVSFPSMTGYPTYPSSVILDYTNFELSFSVYPDPTTDRHAIASQACCGGTCGGGGGFLVALLELNAMLDDYDPMSGNYYMSVWTDGRMGNVGVGAAWQPMSVPVPLNAWSTWSIISTPGQFQICRTDTTPDSCETFAWEATAQHASGGESTLKWGIQNSCNEFAGDLKEFGVCNPGPTCMAAPVSTCQVTDDSNYEFDLTTSSHPTFNSTLSILDWDNFVLSFSIFPTPSTTSHGIVSQRCCGACSPSYGFLIDLLQLNSALDDYDNTGDYYVAMWTDGWTYPFSVGVNAAWQPFSKAVAPNEWSSWAIVAKPGTFRICRTDGPVCDCEEFDWLSGYQQEGAGYSLTLGIQDTCNKWVGNITDFRVCTGTAC